MWPKLGKKYALNLSDAGLGICSISIFHSIWTTNNKKCSVELAQSRCVTIPKSDRCGQGTWKNFVKTHIFENKSITHTSECNEHCKSITHTSECNEIHYTH